jgi:hypothetical protein
MAHSMLISVNNVLDCMTLMIYNIRLMQLDESEPAIQTITDYIISEIMKNDIVQVVNSIDDYIQYYVGHYDLLEFADILS